MSKFLNSDAEWAAAANTISSESGHLLEVFIVDGLNFAELLGRAILGDGRSTQIVNAVIDSRRAIDQKAQTGRPCLCLLCDAPLLRPPAKFVIAGAASTRRAWRWQAAYG